MSITTLEQAFDRMKAAPNRERQLSPGPNHPNQASDWRAAMQSISKRPTVEERFWSRVDKDGPVPELRPELGPCWTWTRALNAKGYSSFRVPGVGSSGHRYSYTIHVGPIPAGLEIDHLCRNRKCVNPDHLEAVTRLENLRRRIFIYKTHCKRGHEFTPENIYVMSDGYSECLICKKSMRAARTAAKITRACAFCGKVMLEDNVSKHEQRVHYRVPYPRKTCPICGASPTAPNFARHIKECSND